jgi:hypothetical protein
MRVRANLVPHLWDTRGMRRAKAITIDLLFEPTRSLGRSNPVRTLVGSTFLACLSVRFGTYALEFSKWSCDDCGVAEHRPWTRSV